jgi:hypothetical protein
MTTELPDTELPQTDDEWRIRLNPAEFRVLRQGGTEPAWTGEYTDTKTAGVYRCRACGAQLFSSDTKFDSHCGWPSFDEALPGRSATSRTAPSAWFVRRFGAPGATRTWGTGSTARRLTPEERPVLHQQHQHDPRTRPVASKIAGRGGGRERRYALHSVMPTGR